MKAVLAVLQLMKSVPAVVGEMTAILAFLQHI
jgi:hypothetical protein